jgi:hypothetical protein
MDDKLSRRRYLLGSAAVLGSISGCTSVPNPLDSGSSSTTSEPEESTTTEVSLDADLEDDLEKVNDALSSRGSFSSWDDGEVLEGDGNGNLAAVIRLPDVAGSGGVRARYADDAGIVEDLLADVSYQMGNAFELAGEHLADNSFNSLTMATTDHQGFGYGVKMQEGKARELWRDGGGFADTFISPEDRADRVKMTEEDVPPGAYLTEGSSASLSFGDNSYEVHALDIDGDAGTVEVVIDDSKPQTLSFGEPHREKDRRLVARYNPLKEHTDTEGVAIESRDLNCENGQRNLYTGDTANITAGDEEYAVGLEVVWENGTAEVTNYLPEDDEANMNLTTGESYEFTRNVSYTVDNIIPTDTENGEGVAVVSVERC